jgi:Helix-turn-helix domain/RodZ C-terminal domain
MDPGVGATLKEARRRREIDLEQVEAATKIRARFLRAIESEDWDVLPGEAYARSFVRTYGDYLGLDGEALAERQRQDTGSWRPAERLPRVEPAPVKRAEVDRGRGPLRSLAVLATVCAALLVALILVLGEKEENPSPQQRGAGAAVTGGKGQESDKGSQAEESHKSPGFAVELTTNAEVWVCLLDAKGKELVDGLVLEPGAVEGPYRSGSFTVSLGNGEVTMTVDGQQASIPQTPNPIGYSIGEGGALRELSESERPTCT